MLKSALKRVFVRLNRFVKKNRKKVLAVLIVTSIALLTTGIYLLNQVKPNGDILLENTSSKTLYTNENPNFNVSFGKRDEPERQWVRFESVNSTKNPFEEKKRSLWNKVINVIKPRKNLGVEMSLKGVELNGIEKLAETDSLEKVKSVAEVLGTDDIKTSTKLIDMGRVIGDDTQDSVSKKTIVNTDVVDGVDLEYQIIEGLGLKEEIVVKNLNGYTEECKADPAKCKLPPNEFIFDMRLDDGLVLKKGWFTVGQKSFETYYFEDDGGNYVSHFLPSFAVDEVGSKTFDVVLEVVEQDGNYEVKVTVDVEWLLSKDRVFPIRIDPSIVHNSKADFDTGIYMNTDYVTSVSGAEMLGVEKPVLTGNTVAYWNLEGNINDTSGNSNNGATTLYGMNYGVQSSNLTFLLNRYGGVDNAGEIDIECANGDNYCHFIDRLGLRTSTPTINSGIAITDTETGSGYIMYSPSLSAQGISNAEGTRHTDHFIAVKYSGTSWQYNNNTAWVDFTPTVSNLIVAEVTFFTSIKLLDVWPVSTDTPIGKGYKFDGVNDYIKMSNASSVNVAGDISIDFWLNMEGNGLYQILVHKESQYSVAMDPKGYITWADSSVWAYDTFGYHDIGIQFGRWQHIAVTKSNGTVKIYLNGAEKVSKSFGGAITTAGSVMHIGCYSDTTKCAFRYFNGSMDEVRISNIARSADEIYKTYLYGKERYSGEYESTVFDSGSSISKVNVSSTVSGINTGDGEVPYSTTGLVAQWNFNEISGAVASSGGSCGSACNGTLTNFVDTTGQDKVIGSGWTYNNRRWGRGGLMFDGVDDYVTASNSTVGDFSTGDFSLETWFKAEYPAIQSYPMLISKQVLSPVRTGYGLAIVAVNDDSRGKLIFSIQDNGVQKTIGLGEPVVDGQWHHVVATKSSTIITLYLDGELATSRDIGTAGNISNTANLEIGKLSSGGGNNYKGLMDSVRIYSRSLTSSEVLSNYNSGNARFHIRGGNSNEPNDGTWSEWKENTVKSTLRSFDNSSLYSNKEDGLVGYWSMNEESGTTVSDISGTGNNGTATGTGIVDGKYAKARSFNGTSDYVSIPNSPTLDINGPNSQITISSWVKLNSFKNSWSTLLYKSTSNTGDINKERQYALFINNLTGAIGFSSTSVDNINTNQTWVVTPSVVKLNQWHHIVGVIDSLNSIMRVYIDGNQIASIAYSTAGIRSASGNLHIGRNNTDGAFLVDGVIDEVRIYNKALDGDRVLTDYLEGIEKRSTLTQSSSNITADDSNTLNDGLLSHWQIDELSGSEVKDSVSTNNGTATGTTVVDGKYDKARSLNGTSDFITVPSGFNDFTNGITISLWAKPIDNGNFTRFIDFGEIAGQSNTNIIFYRGGTLGILVFNVGDGTNQKYINTAGGIIYNEWHLYTATINTLGVGRIYRDGILLAEGEMPLPANVTRTYNYIGKSNWSADPLYEGSIDDVRIYNTAKTHDEIERLYNQELPYKSNRVGTTLNDGLMSYWKLDESSGSVVKDSVGTYNGTATGSTIMHGVSGYSRRFNGTEYVTVGNMGALPDRGTIQFWVNSSEISGFRNPLSTDFTGVNNAIRFESNTTGVFYAVAGDGTNLSLCHFIPSGMTINTWYHITYMWDKVANTHTGLLNGVFACGGGNTYWPTNIPDMRFGTGYNTDDIRQWKGSIDEIKLFNRTVSSTEAYEEYASLKKTFEKKNVGLVSYWPMDELSGTTVADKVGTGNWVGTSNGTATGTTIVDGRMGKARSFNGTSDSIKMTYGIDGDIVGNFTLSFWVNSLYSQAPSGSQEIIHKDMQYSFNVASVSRYVAWADSSNWSHASFGYHDIGLVEGVWQHVTVTKNADIVKMYVDGVEKLSKSFGGPITATTRIMHFGCYSDATTCGSAYFYGSLDEPKIYNSALSATEVKSEYIQSMSRDFLRKVDYSNYNLSSFSASNKISLPIYIASDKVGENISTTIGESAYANYQPDANTVGLWHLDEIDGNSAYVKDSSGFSNDGVPIGTTYTPNGKIGGARNFDGSSSSYISLGNPSALQTIGSQTIDMWLYPTEFNLRRNPYDKAHGGEGTITQEPSGILIYYYGSAGGNTTPYESFSSLTPLALNQWNHIALVRNLASMKVEWYINGVLVNSKTVTINPAVASNLPAKIGTGYTNPYKGMIDEVRISNKARSADEIRQAYEVGLRTHNIEIEFGAELDNSNLITSSSDTSFTIDGTVKGMKSKGSNIYSGEKIIVREQNSSGEYIAQGVVTSVNKDTGAITVRNWESISTFPTGGFTTKANVFKWQKEYLPIKGRTLDTQLDRANLLTMRVDNTYGGRNIWIDNITSEEYLPTVSPELITLGSSYRFFQYKATLTSTDTDVSPIINQVQLDYTIDGPTMNQIMRHGKWFNSGVKQPFWWAK